MNTKVDGKKILKELSERKRGPVTFYLTKSTHKRFKASCGDHSASEVIEALMKNFIASNSNDKKSKKPRGK